jgi:hypothetical protein
LTEEQTVEEINGPALTPAAFDAHFRARAGGGNVP